jgi:hypothetical protein
VKHVAAPKQSVESTEDEWSMRGLEAHATISFHGAVGILPTVGPSVRGLEANATKVGGVRERDPREWPCPLPQPLSLSLSLRMVL